jgi:type II secretory pathway component GspD/PulD (secretin)
MLRTFLLACAMFSAVAYAADKVSFNYDNTEISKVIKDYAKMSGQKFIIDPQVRGMITITNPSEITKAEAFNQLSSALALNGIGISTQEDTMVVQQARAVQRNLIPVTKELPPLNPTRMVTYVIDLKNADADEVNKQLRILTSKDGELVPYTRTNQIFVTDWTPNLHRIAQMMTVVDQTVQGGAPAPKKKETAKKQ